MRGPHHSPIGRARSGAESGLVPWRRGLYNSSLEGNTRRAIDTGEGEKINAAAFKALIRVAMVANSAARVRRASARK